MTPTSPSPELDMQSCLPDIRGAGVSRGEEASEGETGAALDTHHSVPFLTLVRYYPQSNALI